MNCVTHHHARECREAAVRELLGEVMQWHSDPESIDYNDCDKDPCMWCIKAKAIIETGSVKHDALIVAFVQGSQWWEFHKTGATMWASDRAKSEGEAETRVKNGTLGKSRNFGVDRAPADNPKP